MDQYIGLIDDTVYSTDSRIKELVHSSLGKGTILSVDNSAGKVLIHSTTQVTLTIVLKEGEPRQKTVIVEMDSHSLSIGIGNYLNGLGARIEGTVSSVTFCKHVPSFIHVTMTDAMSERCN